MQRKWSYGALLKRTMLGKCLDMEEGCWSVWRPSYTLWGREGDKLQTLLKWHSKTLSSRPKAHWKWEEKAAIYMNHFEVSRPCLLVGMVVSTVRSYSFVATVVLRADPAVILTGHARAIWHTLLECLVLQVSALYLQACPCLGVLGRA